VKRVKGWQRMWQMLKTTCGGRGGGLRIELHDPRIRRLPGELLQYLNVARDGTCGRVLWL
jgi:hypothetical protein